jgi:hypothetical protein
MEDYAPFTFIGSWAFVASYLCFRFCIFDRLVLEEYISKVEGGPHLLQSYLCVVQDGLPPTIKEMHPSFESLIVISTLRL